VTFGPNAASNVVVVSDTKATATAPAGTGTVDVVVSTPAGTSAKSAADQFTYNSLPPSVTTAAPVVQSSSGAAFSGSVNPSGLSTVAYFQYGLDASYGAAADGATYTNTTAPQQIGAGSGPVPVATSVSGLVPHATYHVRLVATNSAGTTFGPDQTFTTKQDPPPPPPVLGKSFDVKLVSGTVLIRLPGSHAADTAHLSGLSKGQGFIPLTEARQLPSGTQVDARRGTIQLVSAASQRRKLQTGVFNGGIFGLTQDRVGLRKGLTTLSLIEGLFPGAPSFGGCKAHRAADPGFPAAQQARLSNRILQTLRAHGRGRFRTRGRYASATVRGTAWTITDRCDGTLVVVQRHTVAVTDFVRHITVLVHQGHSYLARAPRRK
jgi:hypothetical protein